MEAKGKAAETVIGGCSGLKPWNAGSRKGSRNSHWWLQWIETTGMEAAGKAYFYQNPKLYISFLAFRLGLSMAHPSPYNSTPNSNQISLACCCLYTNDLSYRRAVGAAVLE
ncbi:hypothetical protein GDO86_019972 [Hymenochirus boettgeri]|uniref:Uncharacterized protein n=1 Tax=Hymenochirus boettgeri TaxID=247094 RepID=A0A8T2IFL8_9PIPI|nr:hypothetical protein GDO86_019972 [Hymenochirus boettgeri]